MWFASDAVMNHKLAWYHANVTTDNTVDSAVRDWSFFSDNDKFH